MNADEAQNIIRQVAVMWPNVKMDDATPLAWAVILAPIDYPDAQDAVRELARETPFVHVSDIAKKARAIRHELFSAAKLDLMEAVPPSSVDPDDSQAYIAWLREAQQAAIDSVRERRRSRLALASA